MRPSISVSMKLKTRLNLDETPKTSLNQFVAWIKNQRRRFFKSSGCDRKCTLQSTPIGYRDQHMSHLLNYYENLTVTMDYIINCFNNEPQCLEPKPT